MATNLIQNPDFSNGLASWSTYGWYAGNTITPLTSGGKSGACVQLVVPSEGDPGQSWIAQSVQLESGKEYMLSFYAKRVGNVDVWVQITMAGETQYSPSYLYWIPSGGSYTSVSYHFTAKGIAGQNTSAYIQLIAGSAGGTVWFDTISLEAEDDESGNDSGSDSPDDEDSYGFSPSCYVEVLSGARGYKTADSTNTDNYGRIPAGALFVYGGVENGMVCVKYGTDTGDTINAYIPKAKCKNSGIPLDTCVESRMATIADSLVGAYGVNLGLNGHYCESFIHWLAGAANMPHNVYCSSNVCGDAVEYYTNEELYDVRNSTTGLPMQSGDIAYYDVSNYNTSEVKAAHAGYVIDASFDSYIAIEGNADPDKVNSKGQMAIARVTGNRYTGMNNTHNRTLHGVGRPFGRG